MKDSKGVYRHWLALLVLGTSLSIGSISLLRAVGTVGTPFAGFFFGPNLLVSVGQRAEWPGVRAGLRSLDRILAVDGHSFRNGNDLREYVSRQKPGHTLQVHVDHNGDIRDYSVPMSRYSLSDFLVAFLAPFLMGLLFVAFGAILYFSQPDSRGSVLYLNLCCVIGTFCMVLYEAYTTGSFFRLTLTYPMIGALVTHLILLFPMSRGMRPRINLVVGTLYFLGTSMVIWRQISLYGTQQSIFLSRLSSAYILIVLITDFLLLTQAYLQAKHQATRDKIKVIVIGILIASSVIAAWSLNFLLGSKSFYLDEGVLLALIFPLFMGYAILRRNVFNLDRLIRLSLSYGVAGALVLALYLTAVGAVRELFPSAVYGSYAGFFVVFLAALGALTFNMFRLKANQWVYQTLFRNQHDLARALEVLDRSFAKGLSKGDLMERIVAGVTDLFEVERGAILCPSVKGPGDPMVRSLGWSDPPDFRTTFALFESEGLTTELIRRFHTTEIAEIEDARPDLFQQSFSLLKAHRIELLVPMVSSGNLFGLMLLGKRRSRERYDASDIKLLEPMAVRAGLALENAELVAEADRQSRLAALGQMATIMVHDIKNPLSTIKISAGSLKRRFREGEASYELATFIEEEVDRMNGVVQEILGFAKPLKLALATCNLNDVVRETVARTAPMFSSVGVEVRMELASENMDIVLDTSRVSRALENLLTNAREATASGGRVSVRSWVEGRNNGHARMFLAVEDTGKGMDPSIRERVFQPFFTTKKEGTGLGLAIVAQIVKEHGGDIELESTPGVGTRFVLHFPVIQKVE